MGNSVTYFSFYNRPDLSPLENCNLLFVDEIFAVEEPGTQLTAEDLAANPSMSPVKSKLSFLSSKTTK